MTRSINLDEAIAQFDPDAYLQPAVAFSLDVKQNHIEQPKHRHRKGQLILAMYGGVTCEVEQSIWMVPPHHAVWIPSNMLHSNRATENAKIYFLFIEPHAIEMPSQCCTLAMSPLLCALIEHLALTEQNYDLNGKTARLVTVLLEQLNTKPVKELHLPVSSDPKIRYMMDHLIADPSDRTTLLEWSQKLAMSERSLARLVKEKTGLTFGKWRQQIHLIIALKQLIIGIPIQIIAGNLGYDSVTAFITMFKKVFGLSPTQYFATLKSQQSESVMTNDVEINHTT